MQSRETHGKLKPNYPRPLLGVVGKGVSAPSLPPCLSLPWAGRARAQAFGRFCVRSHSLFVNLQASSTMKVGNAFCEPASTPNLFASPQRAEPQKGSAWPSSVLHLAYTFPIRPLFPPCTTELLQKSFPPWQQTQ